jgi:cell division protein FtsI (penicillin-binding protein 3)
VRRAYARRARRTGGPHATWQGSTTAHRTPFVVLVMVLLAVALVVTLWLSTAAAADSYRLQHAREATRDLTERAEQLGREVATLETAPELARRAQQLGMVPAGDPARLVVSRDGSVVVVGAPKAATAPAQPAAAQPASAPPTPAHSAAAPAAPTPTAGGT